jgi:AraC-like DNA-binding protein
MSSLQFWELVPRLKYSVVMPRPVRADHRFHAHSHAFFELALVLEGTCVWRIGRRTARLAAGDFLLLPPQVEHYEQVPPGEAARMAWVGFDFASPPRVPPSLLEPAPTGHYAAELRGLMERIFAEHQSSALASAERARLLLREVLIVLCRAVERPADAGEEPAVPHMSLRQAQVARSAARYLTDNLARPLSVRDVARYHSLCTAHFSTVFRRYHGVSPQRFLHLSRVSRAKALIREGELTVKEIAAICGYVDAAHFCRRFKETTGVTPKQYRATQPA